MRRSVNNVISVLFTFFRLAILKIISRKNLRYHFVERISPNVVIELNKGGKLLLGNRIRIHSGSKIKVRKDAKLSIGHNVRINYNCMFFCHQSIAIGDGCEFGPNVLVYDHDHDFKCTGGIKEGNFLIAPVTIGKNVWIGANTVILRGTTIGDNAVIGAGSIVKGSIPSDTVFVQKRLMRRGDTNG